MAELQTHGKDTTLRVVVHILIASLAIARTRYLSITADDFSNSGGRILLQRSDFESLGPQYGELFDYLTSKVPPGQLPGRNDFDPVDVPQLFGFLNLVEVHRNETMRFRFRLHGTVQTEAAGRDVTGRFVEDAVSPEFVTRITGNMATVVETKRPVYDRFQMPHPNRGFIDSERVYYPLAADGSTVDMILILNGYF